MKLTQYQCDLCKRRFSIGLDYIFGYNMVPLSTMAANKLTYLPIEESDNHICNHCIQAIITTSTLNRSFPTGNAS